MFKRALTVFVCLLLGVAVLCGCAGNGDQPGYEYEASDSPETSDAPSTNNGYQSGTVDTSGIPEVKGKITFSYPAETPAKQNAADAFIKAFNSKYPNVTVECDYGYNVSNARLRIQAGNIGDVFYTTEGSVYNLAVTENALMNLSYYADAFSIDRDDVYSSVYDAGVIDDELYYVARDFSQMIMFFNRDAVNAANVSQYVQDGWNWSTFLEVCETVTNSHYYGAYIDLLYDPVFVPLLNAKVGRDAWYDTTTQKVNLTAPGTADAIADLIAAHKSGFINLGWGSSSEDFANKEPVFRQMVYIQAEVYGQTCDLNSIDWEMIHLPLANKVGNSAFGFGTSGFCVSKQTRNPNAAAAFALFCYTREGQCAFNNQVGGSVPVLKSLKNEGFWQHEGDFEYNWEHKNWSSCVYRADEFAVPGQLQSILPDAVADTFEDAWRDKIKEVINGTLELEQAMQEIEQITNQKWASLKK